MFESKPRSSGRYPKKHDDESVGRRLDCLLDEMIRQDRAYGALEILTPIVGPVLDLLDDNTITTEIKALAASFLRSYGEDWTVRFDGRTNAQIKELLGE